MAGRYLRHDRTFSGPCLTGGCVAFTRVRVAVQLDGCFWHGCREHATRPITNETWWSTKLDANIARDRKTDELLSNAGWTVLRFWEHEPTAEVVAKVCEEIGRRRLTGADAG